MSEVTKDHASKAPLSPHATWAVVRHGGRAGDKWVVLSRWYRDDEHARLFSRRLFNRVAAKLRQGGVALLDPERKVVDWFDAPTLRTRW